MAKVEGVERQQQGSVMALGTRSGHGQPLTRRLLEPFRRTCGVGLALALCYAGLIGAAGAATITEFPIPTASNQPLGITAGPDGALWFTELTRNEIGRITTAGTITEFPIPTASSRALGITAGQDGALWFIESNSNKIGWIVPDPVWSAAVFLNGSVFHTGQTITYQATTFPGTTPPKVDIYLGVLLPDGVTFLSFVPGPGGTIAFALGPVPVPFSANVTLTPTVVPFSYTFSGGERVGTYRTYAGLVMAGSDPLQPANRLSLGVQPFEFTP